MNPTTAIAVALLGAVVSALARRDGQQTLRTALRMGYATLLLRRGLSVPDVERLLGAVSRDPASWSPALPVRKIRSRRRTSGDPLDHSTSPQVVEVENVP